MIFHQPFNHHPFTSTLHEDPHKPPINLWTIMVTAAFFFLILSVYNFVLSIYAYIYNVEEEKRDTLTKNVISTFGFIFFWGIIIVLFYLFLDKLGYLTEDDNGGHPLLRGEARELGRDLTRNVTGDLMRV